MEMELKRNEYVLMTDDITGDGILTFFFSCSFLFSALQLQL